MQRRCQALLRSGSVFAVSVAVAWPLVAQSPVLGRPRTSSAASLAVAFLQDVRTSGISEITSKRAKCTPGRCFSVMVQVKANAPWRLEAKTLTTPVGFSLAMSSVNAPGVRVSDLTPVVWSGVLQSGRATPAQTVEITLYGARRAGAGGRLPTVGDVASLLQLRAVPQ